MSQEHAAEGAFAGPGIILTSQYVATGQATPTVVYHAYCYLYEILLSDIQHRNPYIRAHKVVTVSSTHTHLPGTPDAAVC